MTALPPQVHDTTGTQTSAVLHRSIHEIPKLAVSAKGSYIYLENGQKILDATGGAAVSCIGHNDPRVNQAILEQLNKISYAHTAFFGSQSFEALAQLLVESTGRKMTKLFVIGSGSEAMEVAMKMARQYFLELPKPEPQRTKFIARRQSYHGTTLGALSMGGHVARRALFEPILLPNVSHVSPCYAYRGKYDGESDAAYVARLAEELDAEFQRLGPETVCAFVAEPVVGAALGCVPAVPGYYPAMKAVCDKYGALLILDEVMSGMGRSGTLHVWEQEDVVPDIQTMGKGFGAGYLPIAGVLMGEKVINVLDKGTGVFSHGQTYQGHPVACASALAVQKIIKEDNLLENVRKMGALLEKELKERLSAHPNVGDIRGKGLFWGIEFVKDKETKEPFDPKLKVSTLIQATALAPEYSISLYPGAGSVDGVRGDHILLAPRYNTTEEEIRLIAGLTQRVIQDVFAKLA